MDQNFLEHAVRASMVDLLEKRVLCVLQDQRHLVGYLVTFDQFANVALVRCVQRRIIDGRFHDDPVGVIVVRAENLVFLAELDEEREYAQLKGLINVSKDEILKLEERVAA